MKARSVLLFVAVGFLALMGGAAPAQDMSPGGQPGGIWMPPSASTYGPDVDFMYDVIFWLTTGVFILVQGLLMGFCILYRRRPGHRPQYTHGSNAAELAWTISPAVILLGLAIWQIPAWNKAKLHIPKPGEPGVTRLQIMGEQFKWFYRYPLTKQQKEAWESEYDQVLAAQMHVPFGDKVVADLRSKDVIHSYFIPHMRVKQDAVPGLRNRIWFEPSRTFLIKLKDAGGAPAAKQETVWVASPKDFEGGGAFYDKRIALNKYGNIIDKEKFTATYQPFKDPKDPNKTQPVWVLHQGKVLKGQTWESCDFAMGIFDVACAELCGLGHYTMASQLVVEPRVAYEAWLEDQVGDDPKTGIWARWRD